jgi:hypothetical protein
MAAITAVDDGEIGALICQDSVTARRKSPASCLCSSAITATLVSDTAGVLLSP